MNTKISIIIPIYNGEKTLTRCIHSVLNQSYYNIEVIAINDGSTDNTEKILAEISDKRLQIVKTENRGQGLARNLGLTLAKGEFVGFVDCDDTVEKNMYQYMLDKIGDADICQCNILDVYPDGRYTKQLSIINETVQITNTNKYINKYLFTVKHSYECCNKLIKMEFIKNNKIIFGDTKSIYSEDLYFNIEMAKKLRKIVFVDAPLYHYNQRYASHSKVNNLAKVEKICRLFAMVYEKEYKYSMSKLATLIIMLNLSHIDDYYEIILTKKDVKKYIWLSFLSMPKLRHKMIMLLILILPQSAKRRVIKLYYSNLR